MVIKVNEIQVEDWRVEEIKAITLDLNQNNPNENKKIYIFGYGSIMWKPFFEYKEIEFAELIDYERSFCIKSTIVRGTLEIPGLLLSLVEKKGQQTIGKLFTVDEKDVLTYLNWELSTGCYLAKWLPIKRCNNKNDCFGITLLAKTDHPQYENSLNLRETAKRIMTASGTRGTCLEYFNNTVDQLSKIGVIDKKLHVIEEYIKKEQKKS